MHKILALSAACLALAGPAAAQGARYVSLPLEPAPALRGGGADTARAPAVEATAALKAPAPAEKPWCPDGRRVGTGLGFCLVN